MHARQRNVGNGYRSGSIGMGMSGSRISPERPMRGHGFYGSEHQHRGFNRGYGRGRGRSKSYHNQLPPPLPPPPVQRRSSGGDVFMEAGRLATEYLVSQGVLPQTVLSSKWQNGNFRKQAGEFQSSRSQEEARMDVSAPAAEKRRYIDGYSSAGSRNSLKGRRSHRYDSDFGRSGSWSERSKAFETETGDDSVSGHQEEQPLAEDIASSVQRSASGEFMRKCEGAGDSESVLDKYNLQDEAQSKTGSSSAGKDIVQDCEISKVSEGSSSLSAGSGEMKGRSGGNGGEDENQTAIEDGSIHQRCEDASIDQQCGADESFTKSGIDLATLCKFEKVPTRTRSSLTAKGPKLYLSHNIKDTSHNSGLEEEDQTENRCETRGQSSGKADSTGDENDQVEDFALVQYIENSKCHRSNSFPSSILRDNSEKESGLELPNLHRSHSVGKVGEKRPGEGSDLEEGSKRQRDWVAVSEANERFNMFKTSGNQCDPEEEGKTSSFNKRLIDGAAGKRVSHESLVNNSTYNRTHTGRTGPGYAEEHQLFPASFKMCDLNLGGASDVNDGIKESRQAVDFDLSISSSSKSLEFGTSTRMSNGKEIEVINLDDDQEVVKSSNDPGRKQEAAPYMGIDDVPDYNERLMMVEYLDSFTPINQGTSSVPQNNNTVSLQDREGAIGNDQVPNNTDDDSIFMSLGEIPLTFLQAWDQPPARGYEKPF
ncbi:hypothetical protein AtNW77_Chr4g0303981 [Arabidopsis thaliana]|uniref:Uncharacterized protein At4g26450 n=3 Tax=Arabidopsis TaxID=3701 RepID=Y4645_ARATH|nr:uncharacterized protein AT4G26450 [Arabidopsis thaliana]NP_194375.4 uncharacterized protein AT4G26450 [Arabidopsis thaliana]P0CB21.1 RecName: Full=Uncharacterized protein At4g26450 [Arabidopsis thaliana]KAG7617413.1 hypothetical protein ISN45_At04g027820 [Arabidopsis thaliana x Arabidopsis arenosa]AEE85200.1 hypothetical protein AT4G26450 [Arabidopsis thaliana]ANM66649.1 hypothetical protein AT4G26450 [Arabidopsis thaliana]OAO99058.1 hypothetical protein AXX17_AT4G30500 [Arabidopsis thalia|eukprot:NP_001320070.1 hypothetical protein AT4G26450 [Arabidopsis thaliana]